MSDISKPAECLDWIRATIEATTNLTRLHVLLEDAARHHSINQRGMATAGLGPYEQYAVSCAFLARARDAVKKEVDHLNELHVKAHAKLMRKSFK